MRIQSGPIRTFRALSALIPIKVTTKQAIIVWLVFCIVPHYLLQQVFISIGMNAVVMWEACSEFLRKLQRIRDNLAGDNHKDLAEEFPLKVYQLRMEAARTSSGGQTGQSLVIALDSLEKETRRHIPCFTGANLIFYSRGLLAAACTFLISTALIAQEVISSGNGHGGEQPVNCSLCVLDLHSFRNVTLHK
ncbi:uncharacterized protein LOC129594950 [Paramacrobiotus metropolitanus]|uniref:uncharacterized protein LOC129594950 n=1 Tax=Paramacrobiotus metropolitanus TaxID=2943436 RepID=UPI002445AE09|nr:uncharacterized protein LOC129594950 [Paramacrobiotus metropolitanus]